MAFLDKPTPDRKLHKFLSCVIIFAIVALIFVCQYSDIPSRVAGVLAARLLFGPLFGSLIIAGVLKLVFVVISKQTKFRIIYGYTYGSVMLLGSISLILLSLIGDREGIIEEGAMPATKYESRQ